MIHSQHNAKSMLLVLMLQGYRYAMTTGDEVQDGSRLGLSAALAAAHRLPASTSSAAHVAITVTTPRYSL